MTDREAFTELAISGARGQGEITKAALYVPIWGKRYVFDSEGNFTAIQKVWLGKDGRRCYSPFRGKV